MDFLDEKQSKHRAQVSANILTSDKKGEKLIKANSEKNLLDSKPGIKKVFNQMSAGKLHGKDADEALSHHSIMHEHRFGGEGGLGVYHTPNNKGVYFRQWASGGGGGDYKDHHLGSFHDSGHFMPNKNLTSKRAINVASHIGAAYPNKSLTKGFESHFIENVKSGDKVKGKIGGQKFKGKVGSPIYRKNQQLNLTPSKSEKYKIKPIGVDTNFITSHTQKTEGGKVKFKKKDFEKAGGMEDKMDLVKNKKITTTQQKILNSTDGGGKVIKKIDVGIGKGNLTKGNVKEEHDMNPGKHYIGDISEVIPKSHFDRLMKKTNNFKDTNSTTYKGHKIVAFPTKWGGKEHGAFGIIPHKAIHPDYANKSHLKQNFPDFSDKFKVSKSKGEYHFGHIDVGRKS